MDFLGDPFREAFYDEYIYIQLYIVSEGNVLFRSNGLTEK